MIDNIYIFNYWWTANYGANLTAFALQQLIKDSILVDNSNYNQVIAEASKKFHKDFSKAYLNSCEHCNMQSSLINLSKTCNTFVVGSDQVFRSKLNKEVSKSFLLDFVQPNSKKIAFSASFGVDKEQFLKENSKEVIEHMKKSLQSFDYVSAREKSGVEICKDIFGINAEWVIDPVFLIDKKNYIKMISSSIKGYNGKIIAHLVANSNKKIKNYKGKQVINLHNTNISIEEWLTAIQNCNLLIADSYHAICFAIIFNKPFIVVTKQEQASARFQSLFEKLGIEDQCLNSFDEIYTKDCIFNVDYEKVNQRIEEERQKGLAFLQKALESPIGKFEEKQAVRTQYLEETVCKLEQQANLKYQIKKELWNLWLIIFHKYLPKTMKNLIRRIRGSK